MIRDGIFEMVKPMKPVKTQKQRTIEIETIMGKLLDLGFPLDHEGMIEFTKISKEFETDGISSSGSIKMTGFKRTIEYVL